MNVKDSTGFLFWVDFPLQISILQFGYRQIYTVLYKQ